MGNKIVVKFKDGKIIKGWTTDFGPNKEIFHLHPLEEYDKGVLEIIIPIMLLSRLQLMNFLIILLAF